MDKKTQTIFPKMSEMFLALQLEVQAQLFILHHEYECLASNLPALTICFSISFLQDMFPMDLMLQVIRQQP